MNDELRYVELYAKKRTEGGGRKNYSGENRRVLMEKEKITGAGKTKTALRSEAALTAEIKVQSSQ